MKFLIVLSILFTGITFGLNAQSKATPAPSLEVYYFHATGRCVTCLAVEENTQKFLESNFKPEMQSGVIKFTAFNVDEEKNKALVEKYQISFSTLLIINLKDQKPVVTDFTNNAFKYAHTNPTKYSQLLVAEIQKNLN